MKTLRRSVNSKDTSNGHYPPISSPINALPPVSRPNPKTQPPKKVIRALEAYRPNAPQELGFGKGDFFYVVADEDPSSPWYEAHNPMTGARGLVPKHMFEEFNKANASSVIIPLIMTTQIDVGSSYSSRASSYTRNSQSISTMLPSSSTANPPGPASPRLKTFFAIVIHDFQAERPDELDAKSGDNISVVAQSNREWFVAKPIGKLGRPGLIPVAFVDLKDPATGQSIPEHQVAEIMERGEIPRVEEWKKAMVAYKAASIPLGVIDDNSTVATTQTAYSPVPQPPDQESPLPSSYNSAKEKPERDRSPQPPPVLDQQTYPPLPFGILSSAEVVSFHFENDEYWFRINAVWQPLEPSSFTPSEQARRLVLFRVYDDFYDFQIQLLSAFPAEAGRTSQAGIESSRILPYMPGPVEQVDDIVTSLRQEELDQYLGQLCSLANIGAEYILRHELLRQFFSCKPGDVETPWDEAGQSPSEALQAEQNNTLERFANLSLATQQPSRPLTSSENDSSEYRYQDDDVRTRFAGQQPDPDNEYDRGPSKSNGSSTKFQPTPLQIPRTRQASSYESPVDEYSSNEQQWSAVQTPSSYTSPLNTASTRIRSNSSANTPPISATNSQTAFIKIKIFDRTSDDLIAIRVSPRVSHRQLLEKVRERLGGDVSRLNYRNSLNTGFIPLSGDDDLRNWLEQTDKHVLYAE